MAERGATQVAHQHRRAAHLRDHDGADVRQGMKQAHAADHVALVAARYPAAAGVGIVVVDGIDDIGDAEAVVLQLLRVEVELVFGGEAAEIGVIDHAGNGLQRGDHRPALDLGQLLQILRVGLERVAVDLAARPRHGIERWRRSGRQHRLIDAFDQALTRPIILVPVAKQHGDQRQAEGARGAHQAAVPACR